MSNRVVGLRTTEDSNNPKHRVGLTKAPLSLCPPVATIQQALAHKDGADKYGEYNWRVEKVNMRIYIEAAQRHLADMLDGEDFASDSGVSHAGHVMACMAIILDAKSLGQLIDDRPIPGATAGAMQSARAWLARRAKAQQDTLNHSTGAADASRQPAPLRPTEAACTASFTGPLCNCGRCTEMRRPMPCVRDHAVSNVAWFEG